MERPLASASSAISSVTVYAVQSRDRQGAGPLAYARGSESVSLAMNPALHLPEKGNSHPYCFPVRLIPHIIDIFGG